MTGDRMAHPVLISLANIAARTRMKSSHHAFVLLALLPVPKFLDQQPVVRGVLGDRLIHACLDYIVGPLKIGAAIGIMMADPFGQSRFCFTPCAGYMVDTQEAIMLAGVAGKTSHLTMADYRQFGDPFRHDTRTASITLTQRHLIRSVVDPSADLAAYKLEAMKYRLNGVDLLFWRDWPGAEPAIFLTPESLHHWHKQFWDHDAKWCIRAVGAYEIDFRFALIPHRVGFRQFKEGISKLKQVTGREHRDVERYMVTIIAGAVPKKFLIAIRALMDFRYLGQAPILDDDDCTHLDNSLAEFHAHKQAILDAGARVGKGGRPINDWAIPKLEMFQSVTASVRDSGAPHQWSADITEHGHITEVKDPGTHGNNQDYEAQICRSLDRRDKLRRFELATSIRAAGVQFGEGGSDASDDELHSDEDDEISSHTRVVNRTSTLHATIKPTSNVSGPKRQQIDYFARARDLALKNLPTTYRPFRTFTCANTAFHLSRDPSMRLTVAIASEKFDLPDLQQALSDYLHHTADPDINMFTLPIGGQRPRAAAGGNLPFTSIQIWTSMRMQVKQYHYPQEAAEPRTVMVSPSSEEWPTGHYDTVLVNTDPSQKWPESGFTGMLLFLKRITHSG